MKQNCLWALGTEATHQTTRSNYQNEPDKNKIDKLHNIYHRYYVPQRNKFNSQGVFSSGRTRHKHTGRSLGGIN